MTEFEQRSEEITTLITEGNLDRATRRLLDFIRDFIEDNDLLFEAFTISANYSKLTKEEREDILDNVIIEKRRNEIIRQVLDIHKEVCNHFVKEITPVGIDSIEINEEPEHIGLLDVITDETPSMTEVLNLKTALKAVICSTNNLSKTYQKSAFTLGDINIDIRKNDILAVVGENANGKTTLFNILVGELKHDFGELSFPIFNENISTKLDWIKIKKNIAYVKQELPRWYGSLRSNLHYEAACHGIRGKDNEKDVGFVIHRLGLTEHINKKWNQLSGGYKLRFSLAKAFIKKPKLIVLDEPLANLDIKTQLLILNDLRDLANSIKYPVAIVISSQHLEEIEHIADKILFLNSGKPLFYGTKQELGRDRSHNFFEIQTPYTKEELAGKLHNIKVIELVSDSMYIQIVTPLEVTSEKMLQELLAQEIPVTYFRDISQSIKKLFV